MMIFFFRIGKDIVCVLIRIASLRRGDSNENTHYTFMSKKIEKIYPYYAS